MKLRTIVLSNARPLRTIEYRGGAVPTVGPGDIVRVRVGPEVSDAELGELYSHLKANCASAKLMPRETAPVAPVAKGEEQAAKPSQTVREVVAMMVAESKTKNPVRLAAVIEVALAGVGV